jgi:putative colanic acid biosynthesis UDP-glucose lipid carrier transferase
MTKGDSRNVVIIGYSPEAIQLKKTFESRDDYGYHFFDIFQISKRT